MVCVQSSYPKQPVVIVACVSGTASQSCKMSAVKRMLANFNFGCTEPTIHQQP